MSLPDNNEHLHFHPFFIFFLLGVNRSSVECCAFSSPGPPLDCISPNLPHSGLLIRGIGVAAPTICLALFFIRSTNWSRFFHIGQGDLHHYLSPWHQICPSFPMYFRSCSPVEMTRSHFLFPNHFRQALVVGPPLVGMRCKFTFPLTGPGGKGVADTDGVSSTLATFNLLNWSH